MESSFMLFGDSKSISQQPKRTKILFPLFVVWLKSRLLKNHMFVGPSGPSHPIHWIIWHRYLVNIDRKKGTWWPEADVWSLGGITVHWTLSEKGQNGGESVCTRKRVWPSFGLEGGTSVCRVDIQWFPDYNKRDVLSCVNFYIQVNPTATPSLICCFPSNCWREISRPTARKFYLFFLMWFIFSPCKIHCELLAMVDFISSRLVSPFIQRINKEILRQKIVGRRRRISEIFLFLWHNLLSWKDRLMAKSSHMIVEVSTNWTNQHFQTVIKLCDTQKT